MPQPCVSVVIPAYKPDEHLVWLATRLAAEPVSAVIVVDDGSGPAHRQHFDAIRHLNNVHVLAHAVNLGKGAALKAGLNYALCTFPSDIGVVTADADGQHDPDDIVRVAECLARNPDTLVLGARQFSAGVPFRSRLGNRTTRLILRAVLGYRLSDTQTGLRGIPRSLIIPLLRSRSNGYEFELDMLVACKHNACPVLEQPIRTVYLDGNRASHFNPLLDSMRIYFVLLRFGFVSLITAGMDNLVFFAAFWATERAWQAQAVGRLFAMAFNYSASRRAVFLSRERHRATLPKYVALVVVSGVASYALMTAFVARFGLSVAWAKVLAESILFIANFTVQRDFVFLKTRRRGDVTNWDAYYSRVPATARLTRKYTTSVLISAIRRFCGPKVARIIEIGGANSCFLDTIMEEIGPDSYHIIDNNAFGLDLLRRRLPLETAVTWSHRDVLDVQTIDDPADLVFSVGLVEHFDPEGTRTAIDSHFRLLKPGGCAVISFPTPTWLYRAARLVCEKLGIWNFPDERPLSRDEVVRAAESHGEILQEKTLWPLVFTQRLLVCRKHPERSSPAAKAAEAECPVRS